MYGLNCFLLSQLIRDLHTATISTEGEDQSQRGTQLLEIYALEIQMYNETRNFKKLKVCGPLLPSCSLCVVFVLIGLVLV